MRKPNRVSDVHNIFTDPGSRKKSLYTPRFNGERVTLAESGTLDIQDQINSYAPYTDLRYMLNRLRVGDMSVVKSVPALFGDFSALPRNPVDAVNLLADVERYFSTLTEAERSACNNDWRVYLANLFSRDTATSVGDPITDVTKEVPAHES